MSRRAQTSVGTVWPPGVTAGGKCPTELQRFYFGRVSKGKVHADFHLQIFEEISAPAVDPGQLQCFACRQMEAVNTGRGEGLKCGVELYFHFSVAISA